MSETGELYWHEGLFLQPHHLQTMQRHWMTRLDSERRLAWPHPYGVVESSISADALENMMLQFDRLRVVTPSGLDVRFPDNADLPALDIKEAFESGGAGLTVSIGVPLWYRERANTVPLGSDEHWRVRRIYRVAEVSCPDENTGENAQPVLVRQINARLLLDNDDRTDLETVPILRIVRAAGESVGLPRLDTDFIPPCLVLGGSPVLRDLVRDLANQVEASRKELAIQISRGGFRVENMRGIQFEQMLRLRTLNRFGARLPHLASVPTVPPFDIYLELRELLAELAALYPGRDVFEAAPYDHDRPALAFRDLSKKIRSLLRGAVAPSYMQVPFEPAGDCLAASLTDEHLSTPSEYFLGIRSKEDPKTLAMLVEDQDQFKLMALSLATRAIWGVKLSLERIPPLELPSETGLTYFRLLRGESTRMWERIKEEKAMALRWPTLKESDLKAALYMTVANVEDKA